MRAGREDQRRLMRRFLVHEPVAPVALPQVLQEGTEPLVCRGDTDVSRKKINLFTGIHGCPRQIDCGHPPCALHGAEKRTKPFRPRSIARLVSLVGVYVPSRSHQKLVDVNVEDPVSVETMLKPAVLIYGLLVKEGPRFGHRFQQLHHTLILRKVDAEKPEFLQVLGERCFRKRPAQPAPVIDVDLLHSKESVNGPPRKQLAEDFGLLLPGATQEKWASADDGASFCHRHLPPEVQNPRYRYAIRRAPTRFGSEVFLGASFT
eukprot:scaffold7053_cov380-Pinguiococcus_pyrenoidosus.AAC.5